MNELRLRPLSCPQCGAPGVVRTGVRITECERCGARLCLTDVTYARYEVEARLSPGGAVTLARSWLDGRGATGVFGRPELVLVPYHEIAARRLGVFQRKVPERKRVALRQYSPQTGDVETVEEWAQREIGDMKVMMSDVQDLRPAAPTPWDLREFDARNARRVATLRPFDLVEAQRRATVYAEEQTPDAAADRRFAGDGSAQLAALSRRTLFFPFWSIPVETAAGSYGIVLDAVAGEVVAWRLPQPFPSGGLAWAVLALPGALALGLGLRGLVVDVAPLPFDPILALMLGAAATAVALWRSNRPDWRLGTWPRTGV